MSLAATATAQPQQHSVTLEWDANDTAETITGYKIYEKFPTNSKPPGVTWKLAGQTAANVTRFTAEIPAGIHVFAVSAFNALGEGEKSNEVTVSIIRAVEGLRVFAVTVRP